MLVKSKCWEYGCKHFRGVDQPDDTELTERYVCEAFPQGIPDEITLGENPHLEPYPPSSEQPEGDRGIQFEFDECLSEEELFERQFGDLL
jgi:hypothetical protein